jgi:hypothetical protein
LACGTARRRTSASASSCSPTSQVGLDCDQGVLVVLDGGKALRAAVDAVFGDVPVQRCIRHKERNVLDHLPERDQPAVKRRLRAAWKLTDHGGDRAPPSPRQRARALAPRRRGVAPRRPHRDGHAAALGRPFAAMEVAVIDEPDRVDDRYLPRHRESRGRRRSSSLGAGSNRGSRLLLVPLSCTIPLLLATLWVNVTINKRDGSRAAPSGSTTRSCRMCDRRGDRRLPRAIPAA